MNPIFQQAIGSLIRYGLMILAAYLVKNGIWTESEAANYVTAATVALLAIGWAVWKHYSDRVKLLTALMPGPRTEQEVIEHIKSGAATPRVTTPPDTIPGVPKPQPQLEFEGRPGGRRVIE